MSANGTRTTLTSIFPSYSEESSRVTLKGTVFKRLEPFCGDLGFLFGEVFSDMSSTSLWSSRGLEFWSFTPKEEQSKSNVTVSSLRNVNGTVTIAN